MHRYMWHQEQASSWRCWITRNTGLRDLMPTNCSTGLASCSVKVARSLRESGKPCDAKVEGTESKLKSNTNQIKGRKVLRRLNSDTVM